MKETEATTGAPEPPRKPYASPRILSREVLEVMAAICAPRPPSKANPGLCPRGPINS